MSSKDEDGLVSLARGRIPSTSDGLCLRLERKGRALFLVAEEGGHRRYVPAADGQHHEMHIEGDATCVVTIDRPWDEPPESLTPVSEQRTLFLSFTGWHQRRWHDGPLAHVLRDGTIASLVFAGGDARLTIPKVPSPMTSGQDPALVYPTGRMCAELRHPCILAAFQAAPEPCFQRLRLSRWSRAHAVALTLLVQRDTEWRPEVVLPGSKGEWPKDLRQLLRELGLRPREAPRHEPFHDDLSEWVDRLPVDHVDELAETLAQTLNLNSITSPSWTM